MTLDLLGSWLWFPALVVAATAGLGLGVGRLAALRLPAALIAPSGFAALVVIGWALTRLSSTAPATPIVVAVLALAGAIAGYRRFAGRPGPEAQAAVALAGAVFAVFAAPIVLSGQATFAGYTLLGDTGTHLVVAERLMTAGATAQGLAPSLFESTLTATFRVDYPTGAHAGLGALQRISGLDLAWVYQPFLAVICTLTALSFYDLLARVVAGRWLRAAIAGIAAMPALLYSYYMQGSIKELAAVAMLAAAVALGARAHGPRTALPALVAGLAALAIMGLAILPWLGAIGVGVVAFAAWERRRTLRPLTIALGLAGILALAVPLAIQARSYLQTGGDFLTDPAAFGNLLAPLHPLQAMGVWLAGEHRLPTPDYVVLTWVLIWLGLVGVGVGALLLWQRRQIWPMLLLAASLVGVAVAYWRGSPWAEGKALMIASAPLVLCALIGAHALVARGARWPGLLIGVGLAAGVLASDAMVYRSVALAPRDRLEELARIGELPVGGPTLVADFDEYTRYFLRDLQPDGPGHPWSSRPFEPTDVHAGTPLRRGYDPDEIGDQFLRDFRAVVVRRGPHSRPPTPFRRTFVGRYYEVWERHAPAGTVRARLPLGAGHDPGGVPRCRDVQALARQARPGDRLAFAKTPPIATVEFFDDPSNPAEGTKRAVEVLDVSRTSEPLVRPLPIDRQGRYRLWLEGTVSRPFEVLIDGRAVAVIEDQRNEPRQWLLAGEASLSPGTHSVTVRRASDIPGPGSGGINERLGTLVLEPVDDSSPVETLPPDRAEELCDQRLDWIEVVDAGPPVRAAVR